MRIIDLHSYDYRSNTFFAISSGHCAIIDPGQPIEIIEKAITKYELIPDMVLLTHGHFDHIFSLDEIRDKYDIPAYIHKDDAEMLTDSHKNAYSFFFGDNFKQRCPEKTFTDGDKVFIGKEYLTVIHTPGHSKGSSCFACGDILITGDTLFAEGIGRTDLHGGNTEAIYSSLSSMRSIKKSSEITIYPGHGRSEILSKALDNVIY